MPKLSSVKNYDAKLDGLDIQRKLKELRAKSGKSQENTADLIGINRSNLGAYEEGRATPPLETLMKICKFYRISLDEMVGWEKPELVQEIKVSDVELAYNQAPADKRDIIDYILRIGIHSAI